eukprot:CAMPEP_0119149148 /NCGR_PEP_ID=MMETSP1310-20130426/42932_1 /TAXON_ID=464262 /ORGANISM="Genus nov. species nov., Strain RCC2339" /LENGTH=514 /DNA_ID=CAMNT_0007141235 /DNA_START=147 /DNA_END=1691 /DNA_ORIENTATION=-
MAAAFGQFAATSQFYLYGKGQCTKTGYEAAAKKYGEPDIMKQEDLSLEGRVFMVTGANSGIGREVTRFLASKQGVVYMVCRNAERGKKARDEIAMETKCDTLHLLLADVSLEEGVRGLWEEFAAHRMEEAGKVELQALVCNAGALLNDLTLTKEGVETTFAAHLLFGTYLLTMLALDTLEATEESRVVVVSSGGMYNTAFPDWNTVTCRKGRYDGQMAYARAKRGQVLLCERLTEQHPKVKFVSCHPGWVDTPGVEAAYGNKKSYLEPLRTLWEGSEAIAWLCITPAEELEGGSFYLDRTPRVKHIAGPFFTEGSFTKNRPEEVDHMMAQLKRWSCAETRPGWPVLADDSPLNEPLEPLQKEVQLENYVGRWYVWANIPTAFDVGTTNNIEDYSLTENGNVNVLFTYGKEGSTSVSEIKQKATMANKYNSKWSLSLVWGIHIPVPLPYLICYIEEDYEHTIIGVPDRSHVWIMARRKNINEEKFAQLRDVAEELGFDVLKLVRPPFLDSIPEPE